MMSHGPEQEIEVKFFDVNLDETRDKLIAVGAQLQTPDRLMRRAVFGGEANPGMECTYGRVRDEGDVVTMSAKFSAVAGSITSQREIQVNVDNFDSAVSLLGALGLKATDYQENRRETWRAEDGTLVELEQWPGLPTYIEIEGESVDALQMIAKGLGFNWEDHTTDSTDKLYAQHFGLTEDEVRQRLKDLRFDA